MKAISVLVIGIICLTLVSCNYMKNVQLLSGGSLKRSDFVETVIFDYRKDLIIVRQRSGDAESLQNISGQSQLLLAIEQERQVELAFEGHRWYDLKRTGRAASVMNAVTANWSDTDLLWPIPLREIQNNPALNNAQNPGY